MQKTINKDVSSQIVVKKSKFICNLFYIQTEKEAEEKINRIKKQYHDARHNCYAYAVVENGKIVTRMSDDGEPSGTAGMPMLNILVKQELVNVLIVVTRYFGGILLGTGGLVKAYTDASLLAIENAEIVYEEEGYEVELFVEYSDFDKLQYYLQKNNIKIISAEYNEKIICRIEITNEEKEKIINLNDNDSIKIQKYNILGKKYIKKIIDK